MLSEIFYDLRYAMRRTRRAARIHARGRAHARDRHRRERARRRSDRWRLLSRAAVSATTQRSSTSRTATPSRSGCRRRHELDSGLSRSPPRRQRALRQRAVPHDRPQPARRRRAGTAACDPSDAFAVLDARRRRRDGPHVQRRGVRRRQGSRRRAQRFVLAQPFQRGSRHRRPRPAPQRRYLSCRRRHAAVVPVSDARHAGVRAVCVHRGRQGRRRTLHRLLAGHRPSRARARRRPTSGRNRT